MKKLLKILGVVIIAGAIGGYSYWQFNKKQIIKNSIEKAITKKTDSLYYIHYDSSHIDEVNGNVAFYNVVLQSDSAQKALLNSTDSLPNALFNIKIKQVAADGIDIAGLLQKQDVAAKKVVLSGPVIQIINTGSAHTKIFSANDTLELYRKILGKFNSIHAGVIQIIDGTLLITDKSGKTQTAFENINITLNDFRVDSTKDYQHIISYFVKDVRATIGNIKLPASKNGTTINLEKIDYNAAKRSLSINSVKQYRAGKTNPVIDLKNIEVDQLNTDAFILLQQLKAGQITCGGGLITIYTKKQVRNLKTGDQSIELSTDLIDQAQIDGISLDKTKVVITSLDNPNAAPFILTNARFKVTKMLKISGGTTLNNLINNAEWELSADGFSFNTKNKLYKISVGDFSINNAASIIKVSNFLLKPMQSEEQFVAQSRVQKDLYDLALNNMVFSGINFEKLINNKEFEIENASFQLILKVFDDRNLPPPGSKVGNYPHQQILKLPFPVYIHTAKIINGYVSYRERAIKSKLIGNVFFTGINGTIVNITNIPGRIRANPLLQVDATAKLLGAGIISSTWRFPLNSGNGAFKVEGRLAGMHAPLLSSITKPLAMASVKQGKVDGMTFSINGSDNKAQGDILFLYHDLKMEMLKIDEDTTFKKKGLVSLVANAIIKNENIHSSNVKNVTHNRDTTKSFFNLVWKTIYAGAKNTALGIK